jgi:hypothetical protein
VFHCVSLCFTVFHCVSLCFTVNVNVNFILHKETMVQSFMHIFIIYFPNSLSCVTIPVQGSTKPFTRALLAVRGDR